MKKILVPCDFSWTAVHAFRFALDVAAKSKGSVHLLHVIELPVLHDSVIMPALYFEKAFFKELRENTEKRFEKLTAKYNTKNIDITYRVDFGVPTRMIQDYVKKNKIDLVIMGSHGASGVREFVVGSNAEKIVRTSTVPVLVVKDAVKASIKRIVFPNTLDVENQSDLVMQVKTLQSFFKAHLNIVWINTPLNFTPDTITREKLAAFARAFGLKNCTLDIFNYANEEEGMMAYTKLVKGNMIALGTHGRRGISHLMLKSRAEAVVNHVSVPVWTCVIK